MRFFMVGSWAACDIRFQVLLGVFFWWDPGRLVTFDSRCCEAVFFWEDPGRLVKFDFKCYEAFSFCVYPGRERNGPPTTS